MIVAIHQPNYLPYMGFFDKMQKSDVFVIYDDAQFNKDDFQHRNRIRLNDNLNNNGWKWLSVPVKKKHIPINQIKISNETLFKGEKWNYYHLRNIYNNYKDSIYFHKYEKEIGKIYTSEYDKLVDLNMDLIFFLMEALKVNTKINYSSEFVSSSKSTKRLVEIVKALGGDVYLAGISSYNYLDISLFEKNGIEVQIQNYVHPIYNQMNLEFMPYMSTIDALFNIGGNKCKSLL